MEVSQPRATRYAHRLERRATGGRPAAFATDARHHFRIWRKEGVGRLL